MKDLTGHTLLGNAKFFVTKVPFFFLLAGALSEFVVWLSVESVVFLFAIESSSVGSDCGIRAGAGIGAGGGWAVWYNILTVINSIWVVIYTGRNVNSNRH